MGDKKTLLDKYVSLGNTNKYKTYREIIDKYSYEAHKSYLLNIGERISDIMPFVSNGQVIMINNRELKTEMDLIKKYSNRLALGEQCIEEKKEKIQVLNNIWTFMLDDFIKIIRENPIVYLISCMSQLEYNRFISMNLVMWCRNNTYQKTQDTGVNQILESLEFFRINSKFMPDDAELSASKLYVDVENLMAVDEHSLERAIEIIYYILKKEQYEIKDYKSKYRFVEVLELSRSMFYIQSLKLEMMEGDYKNTPLVIDNDGSILIAENFSREMKKRYYSAMSSSNSHKKVLADSSIEKRLNKLAERYTGISLTNIEEILNLIDMKDIHGDEFLVGNIDEWKEMFRSCSKDVQAGEKFFKYMCLNPDINSMYVEETIRKSRAARSCIIPINDMIICPVGLLKYSIMGSYLDILGGQVGNKSFREDIKKVLQDEDEQFEIDVYDSLKVGLNTCLIKHDIKEKEIRVNGQVVVLPGQIDILLLYKKQIFVIECKNIRLKITVKSRINTKNKLIRDRYKSPQFKLNEKVKTVSEFKEEVVLYMGGDWEDYAQAVPKGVIVSRSFIDIDNKEGNQYPVVLWNELIEWIESSTSNIDN